MTVADTQRPGLLVERLGLLSALSQKNFQVRYKRATLGVLWAVVQPTFQALVLALVFTKVFKVGNVPHYAVYVISGILPWSFFTQSMMAAVTAVADNGALVRKVAVPLVIFPAAAVGGVAMAFTASFVVLIVCSFVAGTVGWHLFLLPVAVLLELLLIFSIGLLAGAFHVAFRDIRYVLESLLIVGLYASPILYDRTRVPEGARGLLDANPMTGILSVYRAAVLGRPIDGRAVVIAAVGCSLLLALAWKLFNRRAAEFPDLV
jgi:ABC-type polysaccharide/polyol phosphate export permease